jgi:hypothetical protein
MISMSELAERKYAIAYDQIDMTGAGTVSRDDLLCLASQLLTAFGENVGTPKGATLIDAARLFWSRLCMIGSEHGDLDEDQAVFTEPEYVTVLKAGFLCNPADFGDFAAPLWEAIFSLADYDDDGKIGIEEFCAAQVVLGTPVPLHREAFRAIDTDGDGAVSCAELLDAARVFCTSAEVSDPRNHLFGVLA